MKTITVVTQSGEEFELTWGTHNVWVSDLLHQERPPWQLYIMPGYTTLGTYSDNEEAQAVRRHLESDWQNGVKIFVMPSRDTTRPIVGPAPRPKRF